MGRLVKGPTLKGYLPASSYGVGKRRNLIGWELLSHGDLTKTVTPAWAGGRLGKLRGDSGKVPRVGAASAASARRLPP